MAPQPRTTSQRKDQVGTRTVEYRSMGAKAILVLEGKRLDSKIMEVKIAEKN